MKKRLFESGDKRILKNGQIVIKAQRYRTQEANKRDAIERLHELLKNASIRPKNRVATRPTRSSVRKRLDSKAKRANVKAYRKKDFRRDD